MRLLSGLFLVIVCLPASAEDKPKEKPKVTGTVEFKQKPTLPEGTEVKMQILDVSIADAKAVVLGEKIIKDPDKTPIAFEVEYDGDKIKQKGRYSISCRISHKGKLLFITDTSVPVITGKGGTKDVKVPVVAIKR
jgi:putative lipoprotein